MSEMVWAEVEAGRVAGAAAAVTTEPAPLVPAETMEPPTEVVLEMIWREAEARRVAGAAVSLVGEGRGDELMYSGDGCLFGTGWGLSDMTMKGENLVKNALTKGKMWYRWQ
jgi:hypothetical protein